MNLLVNKLKNKVDIDGNTYDIDLDFRNFLLLESIISSKELSEFNKVAVIYHNFYGQQVIPDFEKAISKIMEIYLGGGYLSHEEPTTGNSQNKGSTRKVIDYEYDAGYIYAAFMEQYNIDLNDIEYLHWWKFKALLQGLNEDVKYSKILYYRTVKIDSKMTKEEKAFLNKMKKLYALPDKRSKDEIEYEFHNIIGGLL